MIKYYNKALVKKISIYGKNENIKDWIKVVDHNIGMDLLEKEGQKKSIILAVVLKKNRS